MFEKYFGQTGQFFQPMSEIWALQAQAAESLSRTNGALMSEVWQGGLNFAQSLSAQKNIDGAFKLQQSYWADLTRKVQHAADENQTVMTEVSQKIAGVMQATSANDVAASVSPKSSKAKAESSAAKAAEIVETAVKKKNEATTGKPAPVKKTANGKPAGSAKADAGKAGADKGAKAADKKAEGKTDEKKPQSSTVAKAIGEAHKDNAAAAPTSTATPKASAAAALAKSTGDKPAESNPSAAKPNQSKPGQGPVSH